VNRVVADFVPQLPSGIQATVWGDSASYISDRLSLLTANGVQGLLLVLLVLSIFLNVRLAFWVAMGIPISVMGALAVAGTKWVDYSLNDVTTFGLIIALGILVDDAVVVGESVYEERRKTKDRIVGTENGVNKVAVATVFGVLTTIAAFFPMLLIDNPLGKVLAGFSGIVILSLIFSLIESKFILPAHLAHTQLDAKPRYLLTRGWAKVQNAAQAGLNWVRDSLYLPALHASLRHRYAVLVLFLAAGLLGLGLIGKGTIKTVFFPDVPGQIITVNLEMDSRAPFSLTRNNVQRIEDLGNELNIELQKSAALDTPPISTVFVIISGAESAQIYAELSPVIERPGVETVDIAREWQKRTGQIEGATELEFTASEALGGGFQLQLLSKDPDLPPAPNCAVFWLASMGSVISATPWRVVSPNSAYASAQRPAILVSAQKRLLVRSGMRLAAQRCSVFAAIVQKYECWSRTPALRAIRLTIYCKLDCAAIPVLGCR
jgi:multidrug efflux pump subunit AcrB